MQHDHKITSILTSLRHLTILIFVHSIMNSSTGEVYAIKIHVTNHCKYAGLAEASASTSGKSSL